MRDDPNGEVEPGDSLLERPGHLFLAEVERLAELERRKQRMRPDDEQRMDVAHQVEDLAMDLTTLSRYQTRLVALEAQLVTGGDDAGPRTSRVILDEWRAAERRLHDTRVAMEHASDEADRLREEHRRSVRGRP